MSPIGTKKAKYRANTTAMAATMPECMLQNIAQPHRNPASGENESRRNTYTPPVCGNADASSAQTNAPNSVSTPHTTQTSMIWPGVSR